MIRNIPLPVCLCGHFPLHESISFCCFQRLDRESCLCLFMFLSVELIRVHFHVLGVISSPFHEITASSVACRWKTCEHLQEMFDLIHILCLAWTNTCGCDVFTVGRSAGDHRTGSVGLPSIQHALHESALGFLLIQFLCGSAEDVLFCQTSGSAAVWASPSDQGMWAGESVNGPPTNADEGRIQTVSGFSRDNHHNQRLTSVRTFNLSPSARGVRKFNVWI